MRLADIKENKPKLDYMPVVGKSPDPIVGKGSYTYGYNPLGTFYLFLDNEIIDLVRSNKVKWFAENCPLFQAKAHKKIPRSFLQFLYEGFFYNRINCLEVHDFVSRNCQPLASYCLNCPNYYKFASSLRI